MRIKILPPVLAHKIAAGEIVERPASVVRELVENSLDAEARRIEIETLVGGKQRIRVRDDGSGMSPEDARLAFEHHATSKISELSDLERLATLGFRGEALPSIASVSRLTLSTVDRDSSEGQPAAGTRVQIEGGALRQVSEITWPRGTEVTVEELFFNVPARKKFLKSVHTELGHIARQLTHYALAHPEIHFSFRHGSDAPMDFPAVTSLRDRIFQIFGGRFLDSLVEIDFAQGSLHCRGFASLPHEQRGTRNSQYFFVNRRVVRDRLMAQAVQQFYRPLLPQGTYPTLLLFLEVPGDEVDVNVHPCKTEVRFRDSSAVFVLIRRALERALAGQQIVAAGAVGPAAPFAAASGDAAGLGAYQRMAPDARQTQLHYPAEEFGGADPGLHGQVAVGVATGSSPRPLGQFLESFIVAADRQQIYVVDQHVAHERVLYESILQDLHNGRIARQQLLVPEIIELHVEQRAALGELLPELARNGFEVESFGGNSIAVRAVPAVAAALDCRNLLESLLDSASQEDGRPSVAGLQDRIAATIACKAAIKVNTPLGSDKMQWLLDALFQTQNPTTCPHGRPTVLRLGTYEVLKSFKRI